VQEYRRASEQGIVAARRFLKRLEAASDTNHWPVLVRHMLSPASNQADGADRLQALLEGALHGWARDGWIAFARVFCANELGEDVANRVFGEAAELGYYALRAIFLVSDNQAGRQVDPTSLPPDDVLGSLTLGERKARARKPDPRLIERLSLDADASVIRILLNNARLTEPLVVRLCARRPHRAEALAEVARSRWLPRREVQRALALNPYSPARVAAVLVPLLSAADRAEVQRARGTHKIVKKVCEICDALAA